jgi:hypothetical protein
MQAAGLSRLAEKSPRRTGSGAGKWGTSHMLFYFGACLLNWKSFFTSGAWNPLSNDCVYKITSKKFKVRILSSSCSLPFREKEKTINLKNEIKEVEELDNWQPAVSLTHGLFSSGALKKLQKTV